MLINKTIPNNFSPMPNSIEPKKFKNLYIKAIKNKESDLTNLYSYTIPYFKEIEKNIISKNTDYYFYLFLIKNLSNDYNKSNQIIDKWILDKNIYSDIVYNFIKRCRKIKTIPNKAKPKMCQYYFVTDLRLSIASFLKKKYKDNKNFYHRNLNHIETNFQYTINNHWYNYLVTMLKYGYTVTEISKITNLSRVTIYKEINKICLQQKKKQ